MNVEGNEINGCRRCGWQSYVCDCFDHSAMTATASREAATYKAQLEPGFEGWGKFGGEVQATWLPDGTRMQLMADLGYQDPKGRVWLATRGTVVDGASIPRLFWSTVGAPFNSQYRKASVIHDYYCDNRKATWEATHFMFYQACRAAGETSFKSKVLYYAVYHFGPRWASDGSQKRSQAMYHPPVPRDVARVMDFVNTLDPSLSRIELTPPYDLPI